MTAIFDDSGGAAVEALAALVPDGASVVSPTDRNGAPMAATFALLRRGARGLRLVGGPTSGLQAELLIGAGAASEIETAAVTLGEYGAAPRFRAAVEAGRIAVRDTTCPALHAGLQAAEKGVPFMPLRGLIGSDLLRARPDWRVIDNPFAGGADPVALLPALRPDIALIHAPRADRHGNAWIGMRREAMTMAHAARRTLVTVETFVEGDLFDDPDAAPGTLSSLYVEAVAAAPGGAWPVGLGALYPPDDAALRAYCAAAATEAGFARALAALLDPPRARAAAA